MALLKIIKVDNSRIKPVMLKCRAMNIIIIVAKIFKIFRYLKFSVLRLLMILTGEHIPICRG